MRDTTLPSGDSAWLIRRLPENIRQGLAPELRAALMDAAAGYVILPSVAIGVPIGARLIQHVRPETFRRLCMSFDAWIVAFGVSTILHDMKIVPGAPAYLFLAVVVLIDSAMLSRFFAARRA